MTPVWQLPEHDSMFRVESKSHSVPRQREAMLRVCLDSIRRANPGI